MTRSLAFSVCFTAACWTGSSPPAPPIANGSSAPARAALVRAEKSGSGHVLVIDNQVGHALRLHREIKVERDRGGTWERVDAGSLYSAALVSMPNTASAS